MPRLWNAGSPAVLVVAGATTPRTPTLRRAVDRLDPAHRDRIVFRDDIDEAEKWAWYRECAVMAAPSRVDSLGLCYLEAWLCGKPVVAARTGAAVRAGEPRSRRSAGRARRRRRAGGGAARAPRRAAASGSVGAARARPGTGGAHLGPRRRPRARDLCAARARARRDARHRAGGDAQPRGRNRRLPRLAARLDPAPVGHRSSSITPRATAPRTECAGTIRPVVVLDYRDNPGFGEGVNRGRRIASSDVLLLVNPDARVAPRLRRAAGRSPRVRRADVAAVGPKVLVAG